MADSNKTGHSGPPTPTPTGRQRAPTITLDTTAVNNNSSSNIVEITQSYDGQHQQQPTYTLSPVSPPDDAVSPSTMVEPPYGFSQGGRPEPRTDASFDSIRDSSRPTSPHNVSTPIAALGDGFLNVPTNNLRSRQNSVDSEDASRSFVSGGDTTVVASSSTQTDKYKTTPTNDSIMQDDAALDPDPDTEKDFLVENNPFAFSPGQLNKMFNPKSLAAFYKLGGLRGLERGLRSDRKAGLSTEENLLEGSVTFGEVTSKKNDKPNGDALAPPAQAVRVTSQTSREQLGFQDRYRIFRDNRIPEKKGKSLLQLMWITFNDKVLILLSIAAAISLAVGLYQTFGQKHDANEPKVEWVEGVAIIVAIAIVVIVGSLNDYQKELQFAKLNRKKQDRNIKVVRSGATMELSVYDVMVGDVIHLEPGDMIPADGVLIEGFDVKCDESQATGESDIIRKRAADEVYEAIENHESLKKMDPFIQSGARVMEGVGTYMATSTGIYSTYGKTLMSLNEDPDATPLQNKLNVIATYIAKLGGAAGLLLFIVLFIEFLVRLPHDNGTPAEKGQDFLNIFIVVVTIVVVAVPEGLPLAVTLALAFATTRMLKDANLVRHLKACEVMGNATTICSDKTGTLTQNKMQVVAGTVGVNHEFSSSRVQDSEDGNSKTPVSEFVKKLSAPVRELLLDSIALNSTAFEGEIEGEKTFIGSKTETALLLFARDHLGMGPVSELRENSTTVQIIPFDSERKCMGIVIRLSSGTHRLFIKGASEILLAQCSQTLRDPSFDASVTPLAQEDGDAISQLIVSYAKRSLRTIGLCYRDFESWPPPGLRPGEGKGEVLFKDLFQQMTFAGMVGIQDPLREGVPEAVRLCQSAGVVVRMVTGDNKITAEAIARECGILQEDSLVMEGPEFRKLSDLKQMEIIPRLHVLARSSPQDKRILVQQLKAMGETVAVTGDGTNDAPALRKADVGFSMGIAGTEVAKEASAIILMDDNFASIVKALKWGRAVNDAVKRFLQFQLTVNITAVILTFVTAVSSASEKSVLTAVQLLWVNLIMDTLAALALATDPPQDSVLDRKPEPKGSSIISPTMWKMIIGQALYQLAITFLLYYGGTHVVQPIVGGDDLVHEDIETLVFNTFVWMQIFNQWNNRRLDNKFNIFEGLTRNWFFIAISTLMMGGQILIVFVGGAAFSIAKKDQSGGMWGIALVLGFLSIPIGMLIRLIPDSFVVKLVPEFFKRRSKEVPGLTISDEAMNLYPEPLVEVRDELAFLRRMKGGRLNNLKYTVRHPREMIARSRSQSHSRSNSINTSMDTQGREDSFPSRVATPVSRQRSRSARSRSNSALAPTTVMAGIMAAGVGMSWSPNGRKPEEDEVFPLYEQQQAGTEGSLEQGQKPAPGHSSSEAQN
ncbi:calcium P-type ATPase [Trichoderma camerunense]